MLGSMPQEQQPMPPILPLLGNLEPQAIDVEVLGSLQVLHEQVYRSNLGDGEGSGKHHPLDIVLRREVWLVSKA